MSTPSYGSIEASEAPDQGPRRRRIVGAVAVALALSLAIATFSLATPVASSAELVQEETGGRLDDAAGGQKDDCKLATVAAESAINGRDFRSSSLLSKDGKTIFTLDDSTDFLKIYRYDTATGEQMGDALLTDHEIDVSTYIPLSGSDVSPDGTFFALTEFRQNFVKLFYIPCLEAPPCAGTKIAERGESVSTPRFSPDGKYLAVGTGDDKIAWYDVATRTLLYERTIGSRFGRGPTAIAFSPDSKLVAVAGWGQGGQVRTPPDLRRRDRQTGTEGEAAPRRQPSVLASVLAGRQDAHVRGQ